MKWEPHTVMYNAKCISVEIRVEMGTVCIAGGILET